MSQQQGVLTSGVIKARDDAVRNLINAMDAVDMKTLQQIIGPVTKFIGDEISIRYWNQRKKAYQEEQLNLERLRKFRRGLVSECIKCGNELEVDMLCSKCDGNHCEECFFEHSCGKWC